MPDYKGKISGQQIDQLPGQVQQLQETLTTLKDGEEARQQTFEQNESDRTRRFNTSQSDRVQEFRSMRESMSQGFAAMTNDMSNAFSSQMQQQSDEFNELIQSPEGLFVWPNFTIIDGHLIATVPDRSSTFAAAIDTNGHLLLDIDL